MTRISLLFLAFAACGGQPAEPVPSLPSTPIRVSTTPMVPGAVMTLSVELQQPATGPLDVQLYGSGEGAGNEPCVHNGAVCGGLAAPVHLGTAGFFAGMKITSVDATTPTKAVPDSTWLIQAIVESKSGAVASEVLPVVVQDRKGVVLATPAPAAAESPSAAESPAERRATDDPSAGRSCDAEATPAAAAACRALATGDIAICEHVTPLDDQIYCFGMARRSVDACSQISEPKLRARCFEVIKALGPR